MFNATCPPQSVPRPRAVRAWFLILCLLLMLPGFVVAGDVEVRSKADAPADLQALFAVQADTESRRAQSGVQLPRRMVVPSPGIEASLRGLKVDAERPVLVLMAMDRFPSAADWKAWDSQGLEFVQYLQHRHWLVRLAVDAEKAKAMTGATSIAAYLSADKVDPGLDNILDRPKSFDASHHLVVIHVRLVPSAEARTREDLQRRYHRGDVEHVQSTDPDEVTLVTHPSTVEELRGRADVVAIRPGVWKVEPLMDGARAVARAETVLSGDGDPLTGKEVRAATNEVLGLGWAGKVHDDFWNHDLAGNKTTPRFTSLAESTECGRSWTNRPQHGLMTAAVLLGNGWQSDTYTDDPETFRGIAPNATLDCYWQMGAHAHVSSHSYTPGPSNSTVVGLSTVERHHAHVVAFGNRGVEDGYYSSQNSQKNFLGVANAQVNGEIYADSSAGPTNDGRIKPDLAAPTGDTNAALNDDEFSVEIHRVRLIRQIQPLLDWNFLLGSAEGWGQTATNLGSSGVQVTPQSGRIDVTVDLAAGGWGGSPVLGTEVDAQGVPLNFIGQQDDVLVVEYRAYGLGYFDLMPTWFRDHPHVQPNCISQSSDPGLCPWLSQSHHGGIGIGDGQLRTMEIPVGRAGEWNLTGNVDWDDAMTWAGESIQFLGFRFRQYLKQPTPTFSQYYGQSSGGTSGASPVLGGAYALAMENLTRLYDDVNLDQRLMDSVYYRFGFVPRVFGMPFNSTWKALFIHTADDMVRLAGDPTDAPPNVDTQAPNVYHVGPDYTTGYGMVDIQSGISLMNREHAGDAMFDIIEYELVQGIWHSYPLTVPDGYSARDGGLKVTLVWDDVPWPSSLVNNLDLALQAPDGTIYYPWSLDVPPFPSPAATDIVPARRDQPNDRDNVEQVLVDDLPGETDGTWHILVSESGMGDPNVAQKYSLIVSPWDVQRQCHTCKRGPLGIED